MNEREIVSSGNQMKALAGAALDSFIDGHLESIQREGIIRNYAKNVNFNHIDYGYKKQFLANFLIKTLKEKYIVVRSSNSFRQDRSKIGFYDFEGILKHSEFSKDIIATIYLVPDTELDNGNFIYTREKITLKEYYCPATHLLVFSEFMSFLEEHKYEVTNSEIEQEDIEKSEIDTSLMTLNERGSYYGKRGNSYERNLVSVLSEAKNLELVKNGKTSIDNAYSMIINKITKDYNISIRDIIRIRATNSVPLLKNGGTPKTDIIVTIELNDNSEIIETLSIKNTNTTRVSCHDYTAHDYIRVLQCDNTRLADYLNYFQQTPSIKDFLAVLPHGFSEGEFTKLLVEKNEVFKSWVLRGAHDASNLTVPQFQVSNYLLLKKGDDIAFYSMTEYIKMISEKSSLVFGMPFSWTYPSKQRGRRIQLKVPVFI